MDSRLNGLDSNIRRLDLSIRDSDAMAQANASLVYGEKGIAISIGQSQGRFAGSIGYLNREHNIKLTGSATADKFAVGFGIGF